LLLILSLSVSLSWQPHQAVHAIKHYKYSNRWIPDTSERSQLFTHHTPLFFSETQFLKQIKWRYFTLSYSLSLSLSFLGSATISNGCPLAVVPGKIISMFLNFKTRLFSLNWTLYFVLLFLHSSILLLCYKNLSFFTSLFLSFSRHSKKVSHIFRLLNDSRINWNRLIALLEFSLWLSSSFFSSFLFSV